MCGIIGYVGNHNPTPILLAGLKKLEYRGYDSAGIALFSAENTQIVRAVGPVSNLEQKAAQKQLNGTSGIGHTRWATHGEVSETNSHPHQAGHTTLVHNGIIENYAEIKILMQKSGRKILSETDTEVLAHLIDSEFETGKSLFESLISIFPKLTGSYAFVVSHQSQPDTLFGVSSGVPLWVGAKEDDVYLSSDTRALAKFTSQGFALKSGEIVECKKGGFRVFDFSGRQLTGHTPITSIANDETELVGFEHYMRKEIFEQPLAVLKTHEHLLNCELFGELPFHRWNSVQILGCGSARHAGLIGKYYIEQITKLPVTVDYASEFTDCFEHTSASTLVILVSQSGETADTLAALREAKLRRLSTLSITNRALSTISLESDYALFTQAGVEISVASTKAFTTQITLLLSLALEWAFRLGKIADSHRPISSSLVKNIPELIAQTLQQEKQITFIADSLFQSSNYFFLGRGIQVPIAQECSLKLKEISYCFSESYPAGELKHGPLALIDKNATAILLTHSHWLDSNANNPMSIHSHNQAKMRGTLQEVKSRKAKIWSWGIEDNYFLQESDFFTAIPNCPTLVQPIMQTVVGQLFAYHLARLKGCEIDKPRNLAKSVTVE